MTTLKIEGGVVDHRSMIVKNICHQAIFYKSKFLKTIGEYNLDFRVCADWDFNIRCFSAGSRNKYIDFVVCKYDGGGFSSNTIDYVFDEKRHAEVSRLYKVSYWGRLFNVCRYEFYEKAIKYMEKYYFAHAVYYFSLYAYHGFVSKISSKFKT